MTGYHIEIGYNGALRTDVEEQWETLKKTARQVADRWVKIAREARRLGAPETCADGDCTIESYAKKYKLPFGRQTLDVCENVHGSPITIVDRGPENRHIMQLAATAGPIKYHVRRAYVRLLIEAMHRQEIEVNLTVC